MKKKGHCLRKIMSSHYQIIKTFSLSTLHILRFLSAALLSLTCRYSIRSSFASQGPPWGAYIDKLFYTRSCYSHGNN